MSPWDLPSGCTVTKNPAGLRGCYWAGRFLSLSCDQRSKGKQSLPFLFLGSFPMWTLPRNTPHSNCAGFGKPLSYLQPCQTQGAQRSHSLASLALGNVGNAHSGQPGSLPTTTSWPVSILSTSQCLIPAVLAWRGLHLLDPSTFPNPCLEYLKSTQMHTTL